VGPEWDDLFRLYPKLPVLAVTPDGHRACLFREPLVKSLLAALKASARVAMHDSDALSRLLARLDALLASAVQAAVATFGAAAEYLGSR